MNIREPGTAAPPDTRRQVAHPRRRRRLWVLAVASTVATVGLAAGLYAAFQGSSVAPSRPSPLSTVTSALARTAQQSYSFSLNMNSRNSKKELDSVLVSGRYDSRHHRGTEVLTARAAGPTRRTQVRFLGAYVYTSIPPASGFGRPWDQSPLTAATAAGAPPGDLFGFASDRPVSPAAFTAMLRSAGTVVRDSGPASGLGWTGTRYTFTVSASGGRESVDGAVDVDQPGRVRRVTVTVEQGKGPRGNPLLTTDRQVTFGDFGVPAKVTPPPVSQTRRTTGQPYWGFYF